MSQSHNLPYKTVLALSIGICFVLLLSAIKLKAYPSIEWDEGAYLTTFQSIQKGFLPYQQTYLSQPPGFVVAVLPVYAMLGSTLESARLAVYFYSLIGLAAIVWLGWELDSVIFSFIAIGVLYCIPMYTDQIMTFHADSLPTTFSTLALASIVRYRNTNKLVWLGLSSLCIAIAVLIKIDVSVLPAVFLILLFATLKQSKKPVALVKELLLFGIGSVIFALLVIIPFGVTNVFSNVIKLRIQAAATFPYDPNAFGSYLDQQPILKLLMLAAVVLAGIVVIRFKEARIPTLILFSWAASTFILLAIYHPLMLHHIVLLAVPTALLFAYSAATLLNSIQHPRAALAASLVFVTVILVGRIAYAWSQPEGIPNALENEGLNLIRTYTAPGDYVVSDDGILTALSNSLTPPGLVDISLVRIKSGNLSAEDFKRDLDTYRPKMIFAWVDKLIMMPGLDDILKQNNYLLVKEIDYHYRAYVLQP